MKREILNRYARATDGGYFIDVAAGGVEEFYNDFDRNAPYIRRDLQRDLVDYLIDSATELRNESFSLRFIMDHVPDAANLSRIKRSIDVYFLYLAQKERQKIHDMMRRSMVLFGIGVVILFISVWVNQSFIEEQSVVGRVFATGLTVAAWISLWEGLATFLIEWFPHRKKIQLYERLANAPLTFALAGEKLPDTLATYQSE